METADETTEGDFVSIWAADINPFRMSSSPEFTYTTYSDLALCKPGLNAAQMPYFSVRNSRISG